MDLREARLLLEYLDDGMAKFVVQAFDDGRVLVDFRLLLVRVVVGHRPETIDFRLHDLQPLIELQLIVVGMITMAIDELLDARTQMHGEEAFVIVEEILGDGQRFQRFEISQEEQRFESIVTDVELADDVRRRFRPIGIDGEQLIVREIERE